MASVALLTLDEAKQQTNITGTGQDIELQAYIDGITSVIERYVGPVESREVTETVDSRSVMLCLSKTPVVSLSSFTPVLSGGAAVNVADVVVDEATGVVRRLDGGRWFGGPWKVVYTAGRTTVPPTINLAARMLLQHLWRTQQGPGRPSMGGSDDYAVGQQVPGFGYAVPNRVLELLEPFRLPPGVA